MSPCKNVQEVPLRRVGCIKILQPVIGSKTAILKGSFPLLEYFTSASQVMLPSPTTKLDYIHTDKQNNGCHCGIIVCYIVVLYFYLEILQGSLLMS